MGFNNTYNAISALSDGSEASLFLKCMAAQLMNARKTCSCASGRRALRKRFEDKLVWYWSKYGPKE